MTSKISNTLSNLRVAELKKLTPPSEILSSLPVTDAIQNLVVETRNQARDIIMGRDHRLLVVVGPCSIHDPKAALKYGEQLSQVIQQYGEQLCIIMRVYFEKPRTTLGWKGLINDPDLNNSFDINKGLSVARKLLLDLSAMQVPTATEFLDTISPQYISDLISWGAIGARTTESQIHRELASGLSMPIGFKNGTDGNIQIAIDAIKSASHPHHFLGVTTDGRAAIVNTRGNESCHVILRGSNAGPNYYPKDVQTTSTQLSENKQNPRIMIDCSHGNSKKDFRKQPVVAQSVMEQLSRGEQAICGVMIESHLHEGAQKLVSGKPLDYGVSITDACLSWENTLPLLEGLANAVVKRSATATVA
ncbi:MAG: 3-deoxy-7-phosphoheptulonate synthase [Gammaproteobacteria bacterium]